MQRTQPRQMTTRDVAMFDKEWHVIEEDRTNSIYRKSVQSWVDGNDARAAVDVENIPFGDWQDI